MGAMNIVWTVESLTSNKEKFMKLYKEKRKNILKRINALKGTTQLWWSK